MKTVRVLIVADDPLARAGLASLLAGADGLAVVGREGRQRIGERMHELWWREGFVPAGSSCRRQKRLVLTRDCRDAA